MMPMLTEIKATNSLITDVSDLATPGCKLQHLDLSFNHIRSIAKVLDAVQI